MDFILNGQAHGGVASALMATGFNTNALRPYSIDGKGTYITVNENGKNVPKLISNATATLRKDDWLMIDRTIIEAAKPRLRLVAELRSRAGLTLTIPNGMGKTVLQSQVMGDISPAEISMNGARESQHDRPVFDLVNLPLPIIHKDFSFYLREIEASRNGGSPLDTTTASLASRRVAELAESLAIGTYGSYKFGGGYIYGLINFPDRITHELSDPTETGWTGKTLVREILAMKQKSQNALHYGPWILFTSPGFDEYLDDDYSEDKGDNTLRERLGKINDIASIITLDYLTGFQAVLLQLTPDVIREVIGMDITTLQWESKGGMEINFKVMAIMVPQLRSDINGTTGIVHGAVAT